VLLKTGEGADDPGSSREEAPRSLARRGAREAGIVLLFLALAVLATWPLAADMTGGTLAGQDTMSHLWTVNWVTRHLFEPGQIFGGNILHPAPHAVLRNDLSLGTALLLLPFRAFIDDPVPLYNTGLLLVLAFGGWAVHALARQLTASLSAGLLAGILAAFSSHQLSHVYHMNLLPIGWLALFLLGLHRLVRSPGPASAAIAGVAFSVTAQSSGYYGLAASVLGLIFVGAHWRTWRSKARVNAAAAALLLSTVLIGPYAVAFLQLRTRDQLKRPVEASERFAFNPARDLSSRSYLYRSVLGADGQRLFPGLLALVLAAVGLARRRPGAGFYAAATGLLMLISLGPRLQLGELGVPLPYRLLLAVPPFDAMRHPYTFAAVATLTLSVLAAFGWASLALATRPWAAPVVVLVAIGETLGPAPQLRSVARDVPEVYRALEDLPQGPILEIPVEEPLAMLWAARHGRTVVNGVCSFVPARTALLQLVIRNRWLKHAPEDIDDSEPTRLLKEDFGLRYLVLPIRRHPRLRRLIAPLERSRSFALVREAANGDRVYAVRYD
jgi:hypothetical protein